MNEIEKAISYFEEACKESDEIIDECSEDLKAALLEQKARFVTAMAALREKQENDRLKAEGRVGRKYDTD